MSGTLLSKDAAPAGPRFDHREGHFGVLQGSRVQLQLALKAAKLCRFGSVDFTFVREPLGHFLSGFGEYAYRDIRFKDARLNYERRNLTTADAEEVLQRILSGRPPAASGRHMYAMAGLIASGCALAIGSHVCDAAHARSAWLCLHQNRPSTPH